MLESNVSCLAVKGMFSMMDRLIVWTEVLGPLLISTHPRNTYDLTQWPNNEAPNLRDTNNKRKEKKIEFVWVTSKTGGLRKGDLIFRTVDRKPAIRVQNEAGSQAVPLLHLTAVQNDSWWLLHRHHGRADVAAAFQVQQHLIPLSCSLFPSYSPSSGCIPLTI